MRWRKIIFWTLAIILVLSVGLLFTLGRADYTDARGNDGDKIDVYPKANRQDFSGVVLVAKGDQIIYNESFGWANREKGISNEGQTKFQIASLTKPVTAVAVMQLAEAKKLALTDTIDRYIPNFPNGNKITIRNLLSQSSGIPEYVTKDFVLNRSYTPQQLLDLVKGKKLDFTPGDKMQYSNTNYVLLALIIEKASGMSYHDYVTENIFKKADMGSSSFTIDDSTAIGYIDGKLGPKSDPSIGYGAGDIVSTAQDLWKFDQALRKHTLLSEASQQQMYKTQATAKFIVHYGYGWFINDTFGHESIDESGDYPSGLRHYMTRYLKDNLTIIVLGNDGNQDAKQIDVDIASIMFNKSVWFWDYY